MARQLRINTDQTGGILEGLHRHELIRREGSDFEYGPGDEEAARLVDTLARLYRIYRFRIAVLIFSAPRQ